MWPKFLNKCEFCKARDGELISIVVPSYLRHHYYYHESCYKSVVSNPYDHDEKAVDMAIIIVDELQDRFKHRVRAANHLANNRRRLELEEYDSPAGGDG